MKTGVRGEGFWLPGDQLLGIEAEDAAIQARQATVRLRVSTDANPDATGSDPFVDEHVATGFMVGPKGLALVPSETVRHALAEPHASLVRSAMGRAFHVLSIKFDADGTTCSDSVAPARCFDAWEPADEVPLLNLEVSRLFSFRSCRDVGWTRRLRKPGALFGRKSSSVNFFHDSYPRAETCWSRIGVGCETHEMGIERLHAKLVWLAAFPNQHDGRKVDFPLAVVRLYERRNGIESPLSTGPWVPLAMQPAVTDALVVVAGHPQTERALVHEMIDAQRLDLQLRQTAIDAVRAVIKHSGGLGFPKGLVTHLHRLAARVDAELAAVEQQRTIRDWPSTTDVRDAEAYWADWAASRIRQSTASLQRSLERCQIRYRMEGDAHRKLLRALGDAMPNPTGQQPALSKRRWSRVSRRIGEHLDTLQQQRGYVDGNGHLRLRVGNVAGREVVDGKPTWLATNADLAEGDRGAAVIDPNAHVAVSVVVNVAAGSKYHYVEGPLESFPGSLIATDQILEAINQTPATHLVYQMTYQNPQSSSLEARHFRAALYRR